MPESISELDLKKVNLPISTQKRLLRELKYFSSTDENIIRVQLGRKTPDGPELLNFWDVFITCPSGCLYEDYILHAQMEFPDRYPFLPPKFKFVTPMFHPNIYPDGTVCISILRTENDDISLGENDKCSWTPGLCVNTICISIISILTEPNIYSPANIDASKMYRDTPDLYAKTVRQLLKEQAQRANC